VVERKETIVARKSVHTSAPLFCPTFPSLLCSSSSASFSVRKRMPINDRESLVEEEVFPKQKREGEKTYAFKQTISAGSPASASFFSRLLVSPAFNQSKTIMNRTMSISSPPSNPCVRMHKRVCIPFFHARPLSVVDSYVRQ